MQRCVAPQLGRARHLRSTSIIQQHQQCRTVKYDPAPARQRYLDQIHRGLDDATLVVDPNAKTISTAAGPLPVSPLMDPAWLEATRRWRYEPKQPEGTTPMGRFRKKLARNPYALALATPIRRCVKTSLPMPRYFLQSFGLVYNPESGSNWWTPKDLPFEVPQEAAEEGEEIEEGVKGQKGGVAETPSAMATTDESGEEVAPSLTDEDGDGDMFASEGEDYFTNPDESYEDGVPQEPLSKELQSQDPPTQLLDPSPQPTLAKVKTRLYDPSAYLLLRQVTIRPDTKRKWTLRIQLPNWASTSARAVLREDIDELILHMRRRQIVATLLYFARLHMDEERRYLLACSGWSKVQEHKWRGCLLWTRPPAKEGQDKVTTGSPSPDEPAPFATFDFPGEQFGSRIPVHNLHHLLGEEYVAHLRKESALFGDNWLFVLGRRRSIELQMQLWQLQGYLLEPWPGSDITKP